MLALPLTNPLESSPVSNPPAQLGVLRHLKIRKDIKTRIRKRSANQTLRKRNTRRIRETLSDGCASFLGYF